MGLAKEVFTFIYAAASIVFTQNVITSKELRKYLSIWEACYLFSLVLVLWHMTPCNTFIFFYGFSYDD